MKYHVLLLEDILNHGKKGDLTHVTPGFARNFLLPQKKAILASQSTLKLRERLQKEREEQAKKDRVLSEALAAKLQGQIFSIVVKVDPDGHMYGSVSHNEILDLLTRAGHTLEKKHIALMHPIRQIGTYQITLKLPEGVEASIGLEVKPDREIKKKEAKQEVAPSAPSAETESQEEK